MQGAGQLLVPERLDKGNVELAMRLRRALEEKNTVTATAEVVLQLCHIRWRTRCQVSSMYVTGPRQLPHTTSLP